MPTWTLSARYFMSAKAMAASARSYARMAPSLVSNTLFASGGGKLIVNNRQTSTSSTMESIVIQCFRRQLYQCRKDSPLAAAAPVQARIMPEAQVQTHSIAQQETRIKQQVAVSTVATTIMELLKTIHSAIEVHLMDSIPTLMNSTRPRKVAALIRLDHLRRKATHLQVPPQQPVPHQRSLQPKPQLLLEPQIRVRMINKTRARVKTKTDSGETLAILNK